ncbi:MAG TPA: CvpA family protein [Acidimicrobiales bacterium]|nr:CvpA family protein [Acidimicrobiales bacterium]
MSWVDLIIAIIAVLAAALGYAEGAVRQVLRFVGYAAGFLVGTLVAPYLSSLVTHSGWRAALALGIVLVISIIGGLVGSFVGSLVARALRTLRVGKVDRLAGTLVGAAGALVGCWLAAGLLASTTWGSVASGIQQSSILSAMGRVMPPVPSLDAKVQSLFRNINFPNVFASVVAPSLGTYVNPKRLGPLVTSLSAPSDVVKVLASGTCSALSEGTAFYVSAHDVVTNAHVVAGHTRITVNGAPAQVALFDANNDIAVLRVSSSPATPLPLLSKNPARGTRVSVVGFPLDATRTRAPGVIDGELTALGRDIYDQTILTKTVLVVEVNVQPGNSGSPVMDGSSVVGIVESKLISQSSTAYAIPANVIERDLAQTPATGTVSTHTCLS